jgi:ribosomal protein L29
MDTQDDREIEEKVSRLRQELVKLRFSKQSQQLKNVMLLRGTRKEIARGLTQLRSRLLGSKAEGSAK